jgi:muramoyltetrapeptide carboxypeptidase LdcA involved in peptidoglycan recycling
MNAMFADNSISAVFTSQGGATSNACLPLLDMKVIKRERKK